MNEIFISYRREDTEAEMKAIELSLEKAGHQNIFTDRSKISPGDRWPDEITNALENAKIVLVVIGLKWLTCQDADQNRRIDHPEDWVRLEAKTALERKKLVIPVLVNGAKMPTSSGLPDDIKELTNRQAISLNQDSWASDISRLSKMIKSPTLRIPSILLTSKSPRRRELLNQIGWVEGEHYFTTNASVNLKLDHDEKELDLDKVKEIVEKTACEKINFVHNHVIANEDNSMSTIGKSLNPADTIIVGVDTVVFCNKKILDRPLLKALEMAGPNDIKEARKRAKDMLMEQKGQPIHIVTSIAIALANNPKIKKTITVITEAQLRDYTEADIDNYIAYAEPFDKAGAFGIQEKGVSLFKFIKGSYTNVVGLPLQEFISIIQETYADKFILPPLKSSLGQNGNVLDRPPLSVLAVGDINYDYIYDELPEDFFSSLLPPGKKINGDVRRVAGGTGVNFARGARKAGFKAPYVVGVVGGDAIGQQIIKDLHSNDITPLLVTDPAQQTSIAIILRNHASKDTSITLTDAIQSLPDIAVGVATETLKLSDVFYCSGYCLVDSNRKPNALKMMQIAKEANRIVVLDVVVGMDMKSLSSNLFINERTKKLVDVSVAELPEVFHWFNIDMGEKTEIETWEIHKESLIENLRGFFSVSILRTSGYTHEIMISPTNVIGPVDLNYATLESRKKVGYGDFKTAQEMYNFLSPRIVLASKSPQRLQLLHQIIAPEKLEVQVSSCDEERLTQEDPFERVKRLAVAKAKDVFQQRKYSDNVEFIIGADTEIIRLDENGEWKMVGHPKSAEQAEKDLLELNGKSHTAITGIAIIGKDPESNKLTIKTDCVKTKVIFAKNNEDEIKSYALSGEPIGRAGAYAIQGLGALLIKNIEGSYSNVVGLPLERLCEILADNFKKPIWMFDKVSNWGLPESIKELELP
ncbi:MAG: septum formation protein Maf [Anaerolineales bacterium]|nr:septum formation protein Maf [Anaerolineales bacterium]